MPKKRVYFIGSGPSIAMGVPSVNELYSKVMAKKFCGEQPRYNSFIERVIPEFDPENVNFEEILTLLDDEGIGSEIFKVPRAKNDHRSDLSQNEVYEQLTKAAAELISDEMGDLSDWERFRMRVYPSDVQKSKEIIEERNKTFHVRNAWADQYRNINSSRQDMMNNDYRDDEDVDFVITTNYDVFIERMILARYSYANPDANKTLIIKLHGSINWQELNSDQFPEEKLFTESSMFEILSFKSTSRIISYPARMIGHDIGTLLPATPIIVPPMAQKKYDVPLFRHMFWLASNFLLKADELVILGYGFSDYDFYVKKLIDSAINHPESKIRNVYHYDILESVISKVKKLVRKKNVIYTPLITDFSKEVPDFKNIGKSIRINKF